MNFDNNGMNYSISTRKKDWFIVYVDTGKVKSPSFGVHKSGLYFNNLMVDSCEKGKYRRGKGIVHSERFLNDIIDKKIHIDDLEQYLQSTEIVNVPDWSTHSMLCGTKSNVWIVEPGRGNVHSVLKSNPRFQWFMIMPKRLFIIVTIKTLQTSRNFFFSNKNPSCSGS